MRSTSHCALAIADLLPNQITDTIKGEPFLDFSLQNALKIS